MSPLFKIGYKDLLRGLVLVVLFFIFSLPISELAKYLPVLQNPMLSGVLQLIFAYLLKNLATDKEGKLGGKIQMY